MRSHGRGELLDSGARQRFVSPLRDLGESRYLVGFEHRGVKCHVEGLLELVPAGEPKRTTRSNVWPSVLLVPLPGPTPNDWPSSSRPMTAGIRSAHSVGIRLSGAGAWTSGRASAPSTARSRAGQRSLSSPRPTKGWQRYRQHRTIEAPGSVVLDGNPVDEQASPKDRVIGPSSSRSSPRRNGPG